ETDSLTLDDARALAAEIPGVKEVSPNVDGHVQLVFENQNWNASFRGVSPAYLDIRRWDLASGSSFTHEDVEREAAVSAFVSSPSLTFQRTPCSSVTSNLGALPCLSSSINVNLPDGSCSFPPAP
ncbi:hypothetical protein B4Q13_25200, partial [Lacticaseibacillus rhamnosus]